MDANIANKMSVLSDTEAEKLKQGAVKQKEATFVFKGLYLGMDALNARRLLRYYIGTVSNEVSDVDGKVEKFLLSRGQVDQMFQTKGVSPEAFCKSLISAYPIIGEFDSKLEEIPDLKARKKFMEDAEADAISRMRVSNHADAFAQGVASGMAAGKKADEINKLVKYYFCESAKGFLLEIRPEEPDRFFTLKKISSLKSKNFD